MKKISKRPLLFVIIAVVVVIAVAPFTNVFTKAYANDGSTIAGINVGTKSEEEIRAMLSDAIASWSQNPPQIEGGGSTITVDPTTFQFDIDATISIYDSMMSKPWYAIWESKNAIHIPLEITGAEAFKEKIEGVGSWNVEETYALAIQNIANLKLEAIEAVVVDTSTLEAERLTFIIEEIPEKAKSVYDIAQYLDGIVIGAGENFSLLEHLSGIADNSNTEGLSFVGSLLYRNALHTNTVITERHAQQDIPGYLEPGLEAYVNASTTKDISFTNNSNEPIKMRFTVTGQQLKVEFLSSTITNTVTVKVTQADEVKPRQIV
ncbi:MAG: VanW family protein, partial [Lysinibacillus sp.]